jgi:CheY-like chemotaxis protein
MARPPRRILWAEDNEGDRLLIRAALEDAPGVDVAFVDDGVQFLEALDSGRRPDLAVLDLRMPRIGGLEALQRVRRDPRHRDLPVAIFSAGNQPEETAACEALGVLAVGHKPVDFREFSAAVQRIVRLQLAPPA